MKSITNKSFKVFFVITSVSLLLFIGCRKAEDSDLTYLKDFYGVNVKHDFICSHPVNASLSLRISLTWNEKGVASYSVTDIPKDAAGEHNNRVFIPSFQIDSVQGMVVPFNKKVKTRLLVFTNGDYTPVNIVTGGCNVSYHCCSPTGPVAVYNYALSKFECSNIPPGGCQVYVVNCTGTTLPYTYVAYQSM